ncbi:hypothetical protein D3C76_1107780 [compost metagenome]
MQLHNSLNDAQPQPAAAITLIETAERLGNRMPMCFVNARALIDYADFGSPIMFGELHFDGGTCRTVARCIFQ